MPDDGRAFGPVAAAADRALGALAEPLAGDSHQAIGAPMTQPLARKPVRR